MRDMKIENGQKSWFIRGLSKNERNNRNLPTLSSTCKPGDASENRKNITFLQETPYSNILGKLWEFILPKLLVPKIA